LRGWFHGYEGAFFAGNGGSFDGERLVGRYEVAEVHPVSAHRRQTGCFGGGAGHVDAVVDRGALFDIRRQVVAFGAAGVHPVKPSELLFMAEFQHLGDGHGGEPSGVL